MSDEEATQICSICKAASARFQKGEFILCPDCYEYVKGLYSKPEIEQAAAKRLKELWPTKKQ